MGLAGMGLGLGWMSGWRTLSLPAPPTEFQVSSENRLSLLIAQDSLCLWTYVGLVLFPQSRETAERDP